MDYFNLREKNDSRWFMICLIVFLIVLLCKKIIDSWYLIYAIVIVVLSVILWFVYKKIEKNLKNRPASLWAEFKKKYPIIPQYTPPKWVNPAEAWLLYNLRVDPTDLTSLIYQWKFEWLIDIKTFVWKNSSKEYVKLIKLDDIPLARPLFETEIFDSIFLMWDVKIVEESFQLRYALLLEDLEEHWVMKWWLLRPSLSKVWEVVYNILAVLLFVFVILLLTDVLVMFNVFCWISFFVLLLAFIILWWYLYGWWKLRFTDKWAALASHLIGYWDFIKSCDENKIKLLLKDDPLFIDRTLPYATAFGIETEFLKKISPLKSDRNARYVRWNKVPTWTKVLRALIWSRDESWF